MARHLFRNLILLVSAATVLLVIFDGSGHHIPVLPADASNAPVLVGAVVLAAALTALEQRLRRLLGRP